MQVQSGLLRRSRKCGELHGAAVLNSKIHCYYPEFMQDAMIYITGPMRIIISLHKIITNNIRYQVVGGTFIKISWRRALKVV